MEALPPPPDSRIERMGPYQVDVGRDCDGWPHLSLTTLSGTCVGLVVHGEHPAVVAAGGHFRPRTLVEDPSIDGVFWVIDAGARRSRAGRLYRLDAREPVPTMVRILDRLDRPHGSAIGPDGWLYVGEVQRIVRFDPRADDVRASRQVVIDDLPTQIPGRDRIRFHPLRSFVFTPEWDIVTNMGSSTDHCDESSSEPRCHDEADHTAALWRFTHVLSDGVHGWEPTPRYVAHGLRNSVALVAHRTGTILQGENGTDLSDPELPHEELNLIEEGRHYGWPYCYDRSERDVRWAHATFSCDRSANPSYAPPLVLLPGHGAPLGMRYYGEGPLAASLPGTSESLLIALHGYRALGHRVLALPVDARGVPDPASELVEVIAGWDASETGPRGSPVDMTVARDGSVWLAEDTNGTILRLAVDAHAASRVEVHGREGGPVPHADPAFVALHRDVLLPRCAHCHDVLGGDADRALAAITREGWLTEDHGVLRLWDRVRPDAPQRMPLDGTLSPAETAAIEAWLTARR